MTETKKSTARVQIIFWLCMLGLVEGSVVAVAVAVAVVFVCGQSEKCCLDSVEMIIMIVYERRLVRVPVMK